MVFLLIAAALLTQPVWAVTVILMASKASPPQNALIIDGIAWCLGACLAQFGYLLLFDGLRHAPEDDARESSDAEESKETALYASLTAKIAMDAGTGVPSIRRRTFLSDHHPSSSYAADFFAGKVFALVTSASALIFLEIWHYRNILAVFRGRNADLPLFKSSLIAKLSISLVLLLWCVVLVFAVAATGKHLQRVRYMDSRFRQVSYRVLLNHFLLFSALCLILACEDVIEFHSLLTSDSLSVLSMGYTPFSRHLVPSAVVPFVVLSVWLTTLMLLPSGDASLDGIEFEGTSHVYIALHRYITRAKQNPLSVRRRPPREVFCVEKACFLLECSWQTYYQLSSRATAPRVRMDLARVGLRLNSEFFCEEFSTSGFVASGRDSVVVAFRGSVDSTNIASSLNIAQLHLPSMVIEKASIVRVVLDCGLSANSLNQPQEPDPLFGASNIGGEETSPIHELRHEERKGLESLFSRVVSMLPFFQQSLPRVHAGFWNAYSSVRSATMQAVVSALARHILNLESAEPRPLNLSFCGHSLGGALSVLAAYEVAINLQCIVEAIVEVGLRVSRGHPLFSYRPNLTVYTFGAPRIGNPALVAKLNTTLRNYYRVEIDEDLVPRLPRFFGTYQHGGVQVLLDGATHGNILVKPTVVESQLLRKGTGTIANHTLSKYRDSLESCFEPEELEEYLQLECSSSRDSTLGLAGKLGPDSSTVPPDWLFVSR